MKKSTSTPRRNRREEILTSPPSEKVGIVAPRDPLPTIALSIQQPWAWLIVNGYKTVENRTRNIGNRTGPILIHASQTMTQADYGACVLFVSTFSTLLAEEIPDPGELDRGGIVGVANIAGHSSAQLTSDWFTNAGYAYLLDSAKPLPFKPCKGRLGFFRCDYK